MLHHCSPCTTFLLGLGSCGFSVFRCCCCCCCCSFSAKWPSLCTLGDFQNLGISILQTCAYTLFPSSCLLVWVRNWSRLRILSVETCLSAQNTSLLHTSIQLKILQALTSFFPIWSILFVPNHDFRQLLSNNAKY